jgi:hypothetical protein
MQPGMTPEEKAAVMQFMGQTYGQAHQQDQMLVGSAGNLQPKSQELKQVFEQTAKMPTRMRHPQQGHPQQGHPQEVAPQEVAPITPEQAAQEIAALSTPVVEDNVQNPDQLEFNLTEPSKIDKLINLIEKQNLLLKGISLKLDNGKDTKAKKQG